jgi:hypothetical protein
VFVWIYAAIHFGAIRVCSTYRGNRVLLAIAVSLSMTMCQPKNNQEDDLMIVTYKERGGRTPFAMAMGMIMSQSEQPRGRPNEHHEHERQMA